MHWAWLIAGRYQDASDVPALDGVNINWWHGDQASSEEAAAAMVQAFQIAPDLGLPPAPRSRHTERRAVDMVVYRTWCGTITIQQADGSKRKIQTSDTANLATNPDMMDVGRGYGVVHFGCSIFAPHVPTSLKTGITGRRTAVDPACALRTLRLRHRNCGEFFVSSSPAITLYEDPMGIVGLVAPPQRLQRKGSGSVGSSRAMHAAPALWLPPARAGSSGAEHP
jgi:hypothetical protein